MLENYSFVICNGKKEYFCGMDKKTRVQIFSSFEEENTFEDKRRISLTVPERLREFSTLQKRAWGRDWTSKPMQRIVTFERISW